MPVETFHTLIARNQRNTAPLVLVFVVFQKFLVKGIQLGSVKG